MSSIILSNIKSVKRNNHKIWDEEFVYEVLFEDPWSRQSSTDIKRGSIILSILFSSPQILLGPLKRNEISVKLLEVRMVVTDYSRESTWVLAFFDFFASLVFFAAADLVAAFLSAMILCRSTTSTTMIFWWKSEQSDQRTIDEETQLKWPGIASLPNNPRRSFGEPEKTA